MIKCSFFITLLAFGALAFGQSYGDSGETVDTYEGPAVLSRGGSSVTGERAGRLVDFQYWGGVDGVYDNGLAGLTVGPNGSAETTGSEYGLQVNGGVVGTRTWQFDQLSLDYTGDYRHYTPSSLFDGTDQLLQLNWRHVMSRRWSLNVHEVGGTSSLSYGTLDYTPLRTPDVIGIPTNQLFDSKTYFTQTGAEVFWRKSARLSFGFGGNGFLTDYQNSTLASVIGYQAKVDAVYRLSRRQKTYLTYQLMRYDYRRAFGYSNLNMLAAGYSVDVGRRWTLELQGGTYYVHTLGLIQQPVAPIIAIILGTSYTTTTADRRLFVPDAELHFVRRFNHASLTVGGGEVVTPGNGVYLTSKQDTAFGYFSFIGVRRLTMGITAGWSKLSTVGQQNIGTFDSDNAGGGAVYRLYNRVNAQARFDYYHYTTQSTGYKQNEDRVTIGIAFTSADRPLAIW